MDNNFDEAKLITLACGGNSEAFGELVSHYESFVYNVVYQIMGNREDALDISQDSFIKAYRSLSSFRGDCRFSTWLYRIAVNTSKDALRSRSKHNVTSLTEFEDGDDETKNIDIPDDTPENMPEEALDGDERRRAVRLAIEALSEDHRAVVLLRDVSGYSYEDIAEMLGLEIGTVKSRLNRARLGVKNYLIKHELI
ncbi:MAG: sigma-70 family RNA polymerase sigma factor [Eubacteriales bacterium]